MTCHPRHLCLDCGICTKCIWEYPYMVTDMLWYNRLQMNLEMLCVGCLERRLGRQLRFYDFCDAGSWINETHSPRLTSRLLSR